MTTITIPWPPKTLNPNARQHFMALARAKRSYRATCDWTTREAKAKLDGDGPWRVTLTFHPPDRRSYDHDNLVARMKSGLDGIASALGVDDKLFRLQAPVIGEPVKWGNVTVTIE